MRGMPVNIYHTYHLPLGELWLTGHDLCSEFAKPFLSAIRRCHHQSLSAGEDDKQGGFTDIL